MPAPIVSSRTKMHGQQGTARASTFAATFTTEVQCPLTVMRLIQLRALVHHQVGDHLAQLSLF